MFSEASRTLVQTGILSPLLKRNVMRRGLLQTTSSARRSRERCNPLCLVIPQYLGSGSSKADFMLFPSNPTTLKRKVPKLQHRISPRLISPEGSRIYFGVQPDMKVKEK